MALIIARLKQVIPPVAAIDNWKPSDSTSSGSISTSIDTAAANLSREESRDMTTKEVADDVLNKLMEGEFDAE